MGGRIKTRQPWSAASNLSLKGKRESKRIADDLNYDVREIEFWVHQIALEHEFILGYPYSVAEWCAGRVVREALDVRGREPS